MISITFLGTSGSAPTPKRSMPAISMNIDGNLYLFDCGEGTQRQMMQYKVGYGSLNSIFITHLHLDHFLGIYGLIETLHLTFPVPRRLSIFAPGRFQELLINKYNFLDVIKLKKGVLIDESTFTISAFPVKHSAEAYGFVIEEKPRRKFDEKKAHGLGLKGRMFKDIQKKGEITVNEQKIKLEDVSWLQQGKKVVYTGDCKSSAEVVRAAQSADVLIHESTFDSSRGQEAKDCMHSTAAMAAETAKKAGVRKLVLTHISPRYSDNLDILLGEAKKIFEDSEIAFDGELIKL